MQADGRLPTTDSWLLEPSPAAVKRARRNERLRAFDQARSRRRTGDLRRLRSRRWRWRRLLRFNFLRLGFCRFDFRRIDFARLRRRL